MGFFYFKKINLLTSFSPFLLLTSFFTFLVNAIIFFVLVVTTKSGVWTGPNFSRFYSVFNSNSYCLFFLLLVGDIRRKIQRVLFRNLSFAWTCGEPLHRLFDFLHFFMIITISVIAKHISSHSFPRILSIKT